MILVTTMLRDNVEQVTGMSIIPKEQGPKGNLPNGQYTFSDNEIPKDFYVNYQQYYVIDGMLHADPGKMMM